MTGDSSDQQTSLILGEFGLGKWSMQIGFSCDLCWESFFQPYEDLQEKYTQLVEKGVHPKLADRIVTVDSHRRKDD